MKSKLLLWSSWLSLLVPLVAYILCSEVSTGHLFLHSPPYGRNVVVLRDYAFLVSAVVGGLVFLANVRFRQWKLLWVPLVSMALTCLLYTAADIFTGFLET